MEFKKLSQKIVELENNLPLSFWPKEFFFDSKTTAYFNQIKDFTNKESMFFQKKSGAVGYEYGLQIIYFIDELYVSNPIRGDYSSVSLSSNISAHPKYSQDRKKVEFELKINDKNLKTKMYDIEKLNQKEIKLKVVANIHTHPKFYYEPKLFQYTFFSPQDISSLIYGNIPILGLIAGNKLWIASKTSEIKQIPIEMLNEASRIELQEGNDKLVSFVKENLNSFGIVFYFGSLGGKLNKL